MASNGRMIFNGTDVFITPGVGTSFVELMPCHGQTGIRLTACDGQLTIKDMATNSTFLTATSVTLQLQLY